MSYSQMFGLKQKGDPDVFVAKMNLVTSKLVSFDNNGFARNRDDAHNNNNNCYFNKILSLQTKTAEMQNNTGVEAKTLLVGNFERVYTTIISMAQ